MRLRPQGGRVAPDALRPPPSVLSVSVRRLHGVANVRVRSQGAVGDGTLPVAGFSRMGPKVEAEALQGRVPVRDDVVMAHRHADGQCLLP